MFSIKKSCCKMSDAKIKSIASLGCKIRAAKIAIQIFKVLFGLRRRFIRLFSLLLTFHTVSIDLSRNMSFYINSISYLRQSNNILISQMIHLRMPSLNRYESNCVNDSLIKSTILKMVCFTNDILVINNINHSNKISMMANF